MNCPYCSNKLYNWSQRKFQSHTVKRQTGIQTFLCNKCPIKVYFTIDLQYAFLHEEKEIGIIMNTTMGLDKQTTFRSIHLNNQENTLQLHKADPLGDTYVVLGIDHIPDDLTPSNAEALWNRLMKIKAFS